MKNIRTLLAPLLLTVLCGIALQAQGREQCYTLASPDGRLVSQIVVTDKGVMTYRMTFGDVAILQPSRIALCREIGGVVSDGIKVQKVYRQSVDEMVPSPLYRQAAMRDRYNGLTLKLKDGLWVDFRAYDEGLAYRFRNDRECVVRNETVEYRFAKDWTATVPYVRNFDENNHGTQFFSSFENTYITDTVSRLDPRRLAFLPLLVHADGGLKVCLTESNLEHYPGLYLKGDGEGHLVGEHAGYPDEVTQGGHNNLQELVKSRKGYVARLRKGDALPWRIAMVAADDRELAMNNMSYLLSEESRIEDMSWIKPGKVAWDWWNCWNNGGVDFEAGINNDTYKYYIDFASEYGIEYVILDEGWAVNKQADLFQVVPEIDLPMLVKYGEERGVGLILWAGYYAFNRDMEKVCRHYSQMGIKGFKVDFMDRDDQPMTDFYYRAAAMCAKYRLVVDFHGAFKPAGMNRTWPNVLNFEGVAGLENLKWAPGTLDQAQYDVELPFIRQVAGPMDYTPGAMRNAARYCYYPCWSEPMSQGTRCHQLALYVVLDEPLAMLCDSPTEYMREPEYTRFLTAMPTVWDETRVLQGRVGEYIVTARRKGDVWYVGGITNLTERDLEVDLAELGVGNSVATIFSDGRNAHRKGSDYKMTQTTVSNRILKVHLAPAGGFVMMIKQ